MKLSQLVSKSFLKAYGKRSSLTSVDEKYLKIRDIANDLIEDWQDMDDWRSLYQQDLAIGNVTATNAFDLDDTEIRKVSNLRGDFVQIVKSDGTIYRYYLVAHNKLKRYESSSLVCAVISGQLVFPVAFTADSPLFGATIKVPIYGYATLLTRDTSKVPVDKPKWLVLMTAAELIRNDVTKQGQYPNLVGEATEVLNEMIDDNDAQVEEVTSDFNLRSRRW